MPTARVSLSSDIKRKRWMRKGLIQDKHKSFFSGITGNSMDSIVYQVNKAGAGDGHTVVFDFDGNLSGRAIKGRDRAYGNGEQKRKFSDKLTVERYRLVVDNGDEFDGVDIGDLSITQHGDSRAKLADLFYRFKDQTLFDAAQGLTGTTPSHIIDLGTTFTYNKLLDISELLRTSRPAGFTTGGIRRPLKPYQLKSGKMQDEPCWLMLVDSTMAKLLKQDSSYQTLVYNADYRGDKNRALRGIIGKIDNLWIVEAPLFFGRSLGSSSLPIGFNENEVEIAGLRQFDTVNSAWTGQDGYDSASTIKSRGLIMGAGALQIAFGKEPDYKHQKSEDFGITSESAVEFWMQTQKCRLITENSEDYEQAKVADIDYGIIAVDVQVQA